MVESRGVVASVESRVLCVSVHAIGVSVVGRPGVGDRVVLLVTVDGCIQQL